MATFTELNLPGNNISITSHSWNKERNKIALCPNNNEVHIFEKVDSEWTLATILKEHDKLVTGIDWAPNTNRIVTCSQDRNAYVWNFDGNQWKPTLVLLRINRAATCVKWCPSEEKFAVGCGARLISVCYFEKDNDWWISKHIKKPIRSTVLSVDWHPDSVLLAAGASDMKARVFSALVKDYDPSPSATPWTETFAFGSLNIELGNEHGGWIHSISFSPSGNSLAFVGHDSTLTIYNSNTKKSSILKTPFLPYLCVFWLSESSIICAGFDCSPMLYATTNAEDWSFISKIDQKQKKAMSSNSAMNMFKQMDSRAQQSESSDADLNSVHQNAITCTRVIERTPSIVKFSTSGLDGKIVVWDFPISSSEELIKNLSINSK
ncbi:hypothetical protein ROZALSC1DRAFT_26513 [Rozella allomycis CSF55]|uniref:Actin-related protein 2/3 complex subunit n=1 Tax=Rozella allomycis (strain CSF55) TaxID=988480 RepID=A0A075B4M1_ROZAC|nr:ARP2/3 complex, 41kDa subunit (p41-arc) domain-containing protein [Rozella allomycis CSF55]RKP22088.1 hypothetical protein ROZALSC1DRAFT_26513 [Rozella allomycis CSF55]|eukprot:EPZ36462.1 ARP2/3 complex, 41kDa subunit (p41-arc) domain-containing protein [Rozella allomycis CSF55]